MTASSSNTKKESPGAPGLEMEQTSYLASNFNMEPKVPQRGIGFINSGKGESIPQNSTAQAPCCWEVFAHLMAMALGSASLKTAGTPPFLGIPYKSLGIPCKSLGIPYKFLGIPSIIIS